MSEPGRQRDGRTPPRARRRKRHTARDLANTYRSGDPLFAFDADMQVVAWNDAAEQLTGIRADEAVGQPCWDVLHGVSERGDLICHPGCSTARLAKEGWPQSCSRMYISTPGGRKLVSVSTISVHEPGEAPLILNLLRNGYATAGTKRAAQKLTARQIEVLQCLAAGKQVRAIARELAISETTARNHVAAILRRLGCHSQLEAVAEARRLELI